MTLKRPIVPELRSIPLSYLDCDAKGTEGYIIPRVSFCAIGFPYSCDFLRELKECPRHYP
jgi:hypothetical protein